MDAEKILLLVAAPAGTDQDDLLSALRAEGQRLLGDLGPSARAQVSGVVPPRPHAALEEGTYELVLQRGLSNGVLLGGFDAVLDLTVAGGAPADLGSRLATVVETLGPRIDRARSAVVAGKVHVMLDGTGDIQLYYCMRRLAEVSATTFSQYWREQHAQVGLVTPGLAGYDQLHADEPESSALARAAGVGVADFDGVALEWFAVMDDFIKAAGSPPSHAVKAKASEGNFNDIERATAIITTFEELEGPTDV